MHCAEISLDEYIRRNNGDQFALLNHRKRHQNINKEDLNKSLDQYIRDARGSNFASSTTEKTTTKSGNGKFDRKSLLSDEESEDEDEMPKLVRLEEDVEMEDAEADEATDAKEAEEAADDVDDMFKFQTVESKYGVRVRSQQWRLLSENLEERPEGMKRLEFLPLDEEERYKRVQNGRIQKFRSRTSSMSSNISKRSANFIQEGIHAQGTFVEKGSFTIKYGDRNGIGDKGVIGIERAKRINPPTPRAAEVPVDSHIPGSSAPPITINMNWDGFFKGMKTAAAPKAPEPPKTAEEKLQVAALNLLKMLRDERAETIENLVKTEADDADIPEVSSRYSRFL